MHSIRSARLASARPRPRPGRRISPKRTTSGSRGPGRRRDGDFVVEEPVDLLQAEARAASWQVADRTDPCTSITRSEPAHVQHVDVLRDHRVEHAAALELGQARWAGLGSTSPSL